MSDEAETMVNATFTDEWHVSPMPGQRLYVVPALGEEYEQGEREVTQRLAEAHVISSEIADNPNHHRVVLDIDIPAKIVASSTIGHGHLYIDTPPIPWDKYVTLLNALVDCGVIEPGFRDASVSRGGSMVRLPWVDKHDNGSRGDE